MLKSTKQLAKELGLLRKRPLSSASPRALRKRPKNEQIFSYLIVIDFESTCWDNDKLRTQEIIEFPAVLLNTSTGQVEDQFHYYVQPSEQPSLSEFCQQLTGITQDVVDNGIPISMCIRKFAAWLRKLKDKRGIECVCDTSMPPDLSTDKKSLAALVTWSDWDLGVCLLYESRRKQITRPGALNHWIDLRATYRKFYQRRPEGLNGALKEIGIEFDGREHSGLDDAKNTARLAWKMIRDGCMMNLTKSLKTDRPVFSTAQNSSGSTLHQTRITPPVKNHTPKGKSKQNLCPFVICTDNYSESSSITKTIKTVGKKQGLSLRNQNTLPKKVFDNLDAKKQNKESLFETGSKTHKNDMFNESAANGCDRTINCTKFIMNSPSKTEKNDTSNTFSIKHTPRRSPRRLLNSPGVSNKSNTSKIISVENTPRRSPRRLANSPRVSGTSVSNNQTTATNASKRTCITTSLEYDIKKVNNKTLSESKGHGLSYTLDGVNSIDGDISQSESNQSTYEKSVSETRSVLPQVRTALLRSNKTTPLTTCSRRLQPYKMPQASHNCVVTQKALSEEPNDTHSKIVGYNTVANSDRQSIPSTSPKSISKTNTSTVKSSPLNFSVQTKRLSPFSGGTNTLSLGEPSGSTSSLGEPSGSISSESSVGSTTDTLTTPSPPLRLAVCKSSSNIVKHTFKTPSPPYNMIHKSDIKGNMRPSSSFSSSISNNINNTTHTTSTFKTPSPTGTLVNSHNRFGYSNNNATSIHKTPANVSNINTFHSNQKIFYPFRTPSPTFSGITNKSTSSSSTMQATPPLCRCGRRSKRRLVQNCGPNNGRLFFSCSMGKPKSDTPGSGRSGCGFFQWDIHSF